MSATCLRRGSVTGLEFIPSSADLTATFTACLPDEPGIMRRKMFGWPAAFVRGWMFANLHRESIVVRLPESDLAELMMLPGARSFEPMPGRAMKGYGVLPANLHEDHAAVSSWIERAYRAATALPPKK